MARTQRNKATESHFGVLKARLAKLRRELIAPKGGGGSSGEGFDVAKTGDARIGFVGECWLVVVRPEVNIYNTRYSGGPSAREVLSEDNECTPDCSEGEH